MIASSKPKALPNAMQSSGVTVHGICNVSKGTLRVDETPSVHAGGDAARNSRGERS